MGFFMTAGCYDSTIWDREFFARRSIDDGCSCADEYTTADSDIAANPDARA